MNTLNTVADQLVNLLVDSGISMFFGIPGGPVSPVFDSVLRCQQATLIESRQETAAAFAAACYFEETGKTAAIIVTAGPGGTNAVTGVTSAFLKKTPMIVICGDVAWAEKGERLIQDCGPNGIHMESIYTSVTRQTIRILEPRSAPEEFIRTLEICHDETNPGPVLIMLPIQVAAHPATEAVRNKNKNKRTILFKDDMTIFGVRELLHQAKKPLLVIGNGCRKFSADIRQLVNTMGVPFVTTPQAKGVVSEDHPLSLRNGGLAASGWARKYCNEGNEIDVCLALGTDLDDCATGPTKYVWENTKLIHVDNDPKVFNRNFTTFLTLQYDLAFFINQLCSLIKDVPVHNVLWKLMIDEVKSSSPFDYPGYRTDESETITPHRAIADIQAAMPVHTRYISDIGEHMLFALHYLTIQDPDTFHLSLNLGSMGSGIAGAIGLALGNPHKPVVCICGDGGMQMMGMEVLVARKMNLPIIYAIFNDRRYNMVYHGFKTLYGYNHPWETSAIDFTKWAESLGVKAYSIQHPGDLSEEMIRGALQKSEPVILDIGINRDVRISGAGRNETLQHMSVGKDLLKEGIL